MQQQDLMLSRRQKTLSSISNYLPLHIVLNQPAGVKFSITVPKSFTVEQLARQIEAEYAFLVEREVGTSRYPVIECGALFDHVERDDLLLASSSSRRSLGGDDEDEDEEEGVQDEAESRGVQLRFSDKVEDVLDRDSTVHVVNIDQGLGMGRKLSLTNLALAVGNTSIDQSQSDGQDEVDDPAKESFMVVPAPSSASPLRPPAALSSMAVNAHHLSPLPFGRDSDQLSTISSAQATTASTPLHSPLTTTDANSPRDTIHSSHYRLASGSPLQTLHSSATTRLHPMVSSPLKTTLEPKASNATDDTAATLLASPFASSSSLSSYLKDGSTTINEALKVASHATRVLADSASATSSTSSSSRAYRPRSRATDLLLNLESSSNDARFQEILHNTIALDHFRQFCFQEYSIENLLFWLDVELFAKPSAELLEMDRTDVPAEDLTGSEPVATSTTTDPKVVGGGQFAVQHARYIYLTYIDSCGPLQVNLSDESRTDIPWPILDHVSVMAKNEETVGLGLGLVQEGWPLDRHMFDGAQEHTYQLMKGHTLVRFEESDLWKAVETIMRERPKEYAQATIHGPLNSHYRPEVGVILDTVTRSRSRHPTAKPQTLYNWNNSTSDLDRSRDKEEALAKTMSQYFGPIPPGIRHPGRVILGLGGMHDDEEDEYEDLISSREDSSHAEGGAGGGQGRFGGGIGSALRSPGRKLGGLRKGRLANRLGGGGGGPGSSASRKTLSTASEEMMMMEHEQDLLEIDSVENGKRTTRWMVAGYFNDQVRLTAAQRKRLLRRNNKLTKFFGSRVDGTLRPVEQIMEENEGELAGSSSLGGSMVGGLRAVGSTSAPSLGSPLAYALSSSTIHDIAHSKKKRIGKKNKDFGDRASRRFDSSGRDHSLNRTKSPPGKSSNSLLQKFKKSSSMEYEDEFRSTLLPTLGMGGSLGRLHSPPLEQQQHRGFSLRKSASAAAGERGNHVRSVTTAEIHHPNRFAAHPHPLWSGSLSDQEGQGTNSAYERRRGLSILSLMAGGLNNASPAASPLPQGVAGVNAAAVGSREEAALDRQAMYSRRKKADKLSNFFGAQLSTLELSSQLAMEAEDEEEAYLGGSSDSQNRASTESQPGLFSKTAAGNKKAAGVGPFDEILQIPLRGGPTVSSANQLSTRERNILWKRNKKLRELLGESLPEAEVALALTRPMLLVGPKGKLAALSSPHTYRPQGRRGSKTLRKKRQGSLYSKHEDEDGKDDGTVAGEDDGDEEYEDEEDEGPDSLMDQQRQQQEMARERNLLSKRNKKLRGLLGESLPEAELALALARPRLLVGLRGKPASLSSPTFRGLGRRGSKTLRKKRQGSLHSKYEDDVAAEDRGDEKYGGRDQEEDGEYSVDGSQAPLNARQHHQQREEEEGFRRKGVERKATAGGGETVEERSSEETVESLGVSDTQFRVEL